MLEPLLGIGPAGPRFAPVLEVVLEFVPRNPRIQARKVVPGRSDWNLPRLEETVAKTSCETSWMS